MLVVERNGEAFDFGLAGGEILNRGICNRVSPGQQAAGAGAGSVAILNRGERAKRGANRGAGRRYQMYVAKVDVSEADGPTVGQVAAKRAL